MVAYRPQQPGTSHLLVLSAYLQTTPSGAANALSSQAISHLVVWAKDVLA